MADSGLPLMISEPVAGCLVMPQKSHFLDSIFEKTSESG